MKKIFWKICLPMIAALLLLPGCANEDEKLYHSAISKVDTGGIFLNYNNHTDLVATWDAICQKMASDPDFPPEIPAKIRAFILGFHLQNVRATACSIKNAGDNVFRVRHTMLMSSQVNSAKRNINYHLVEKLPPDTILALGGKLNAKWCWYMFGRIVKFSDDKKLKQTHNFVDAILDEPAFAGVLDSVNGEYQIILCGQDVENPNFFISLPDKKGKLATMLRAFLPFKNDEYQIEKANLFGDQQVSPKIRIEEKRIVIIDSDETYKRVTDTKKGNNFFSTEKLQRFKSGNPQRGIFYLVANVNEKNLNGLLTEGNVALVKPKRDYVLLYNMNRDFDAYCGTALTDAPVSKIISSCGILLLSPMMLL